MCALSRITKHPSPLKFLTKPCISSIYPLHSMIESTPMPSIYNSCLNLDITAPHAFTFHMPPSSSSLSFPLHHATHNRKSNLTLPPFSQKQQEPTAAPYSNQLHPSSRTSKPLNHGHASTTTKP